MTPSEKHTLMRVKSRFGVIKATKQRPTGAEKPQINFQTGLMRQQRVKRAHRNLLQAQLELVSAEFDARLAAVETQLAAFLQARSQSRPQSRSQARPQARNARQIASLEAEIAAQEESFNAQRKAFQEHEAEFAAFEESHNAQRKAFQESHNAQRRAFQESHNAQMAAFQEELAQLERAEIVDDIDDAVAAGDYEYDDAEARVVAPGASNFQRLREQLVCDTQPEIPHHNQHNLRKSVVSASSACSPAPRDESEYNTLQGESKYNAHPLNASFIMRGSGTRGTDTRGPPVVAFDKH